MKKIVVVVLFNLTIISLPTSGKSSQTEEDRITPQPNYPDQVAMESLWRPIESPTQVTQQDHSIIHEEKSQPSPVITMMDFDPLAAMSSAQEYVEKALEMRHKFSEKSDKFPAHSFADYKSEFEEPVPFDTELDKRLRKHMARARPHFYPDDETYSHHESKRVRPRDNEEATGNFEENPRPKRPRPRKRPRPQTFEPERTRTRLPMTDTFDVPETEHHQVHKKHKLSPFDQDNAASSDTAVSPKKRPRIRYNKNRQRPADSSPEGSDHRHLISDWHTNFNVPQQDELLTDIPVLQAFTTTTTVRPKMRIRMKRPNSTTHEPKLTHLKPVKVHGHAEEHFNSLTGPFRAFSSYEAAKQEQDSEPQMTGGRVNLKVEQPQEQTFDFPRQPARDQPRQPSQRQPFEHTREQAFDFPRQQPREPPQEQTREQSFDFSREPPQEQSFEPASGQDFGFPRQQVPEEQGRPSYVSKSKTVEHADSSTSTNYYYEPIVEVVEEPETMDIEKIRAFNRSTTPTNDIQAYYMTHPTPNPPASSPRPSGKPKSKLIYHPTPPRIHFKGSQPHLNASVFIKADHGSDDPYRQGSQTYQIVKKVRPTGRYREQWGDAAESQIVSYTIANETAKGEPELKPHTPQFHLNEFQANKVPIYYGNSNVSSNSSTTPAPEEDSEERFRGFFSSTVASILESSLIRPSSTPSSFPVDNTERSATDEDSGEQSGESYEENEVSQDPLEAAESGKNQYVVLYEVEDKPKPKRRPRPRPPPKSRTTKAPQLVTQQIHYHHHGNPSPPSQNKHSQGGSYQGTYGGKGPYDGDNDEGPDVTHTHHEYVHFDSEPAVAHIYNEGPMTDHYNVANPGANAVYDLKSAHDFDFRHSPGHNLDTRHVPVPDYDNLRFSQMHGPGQRGRVEQPFNFNSYGERPYYYYDSERQASFHDLEAYGSAPQQSVVKPFEVPDQMQMENQQNKLKITDPLNPTQTIEITKDDYVRHVKLAVEKYLKSKEQRSTTPLPPTNPPSSPNVPQDQNPYFNNVAPHFHAGGGPPVTGQDEPQVFLNKGKPFGGPPISDLKTPLQGFQKPVERPLNYHEGHVAEGKVPLNDDTYRRLRETMETSFLTPMKPITLPPKKNLQLGKLAASTPSGFQPRPVPSIRPQHPPPNFNIMKHVRYPKGTFSAGKPLADAIYNMQESLGNDVDLTNKHFRNNGRPIDVSAIDVGQSYIHGNSGFDSPGGQGGGSPKLRFNNNVYQDINSLQFKPKDAELAQSSIYSDLKPGTNPKRGHSTHHVAHTLSNELQSAPVQIINGIPVANPYNIDMDTLRFMLGGMPQGMTMTKDPTDPFNMQTLKVLPNIASVGLHADSLPTIASAFSQQTNTIRKPNQVKPNYNPNHVPGKLLRPPNKHSKTLNQQQGPHPNLRPNNGPFQPNLNPNQANFGPNPRNPVGQFNPPPQKPQGKNNFGENGPLNQNNPQNGGFGASNSDNLQKNSRNFGVQNVGFNGENGQTFQTSFPDPEFSNMNIKWNHYTPNTSPFASNPSQTPPPWLRDNTNVNSFNAARPSQEPQLYLRTYRRVPTSKSTGNQISSKQSRDPETSLRPPPRFRKKVSRARG